MLLRILIFILIIAVGVTVAWFINKKLGFKSLANPLGLLASLISAILIYGFFFSDILEPPPPPSLSRTYDQLMVKMGDYFPDMQSSQLESGESRRMGTSDPQKAAAIYEIEVEPNKPATRVSMSFFAAKGGNSREENLQATLLNMGAMTVTGIMIQNVFPGWTDGPKIVMKGLLDLTKQQPENDQPSKSEITRDDKTIQLNFIKSLGMFVVTVAPRKI